MAVAFVVAAPWAASPARLVGGAACAPACRRAIAAAGARRVPGAAASGGGGGGGVRGGRAGGRLTMETLVWAPVGPVSAVSPGATPFEAVGLSLTLVYTVRFGDRGQAGGGVPEGGGGVVLVCFPLCAPIPWTVAGTDAPAGGWVEACGAAPRVPVANR